MEGRENGNYICPFGAFRVLSGALYSHSLTGKNFFPAWGDEKSRPKAAVSLQESKARENSDLRDKGAGYI